MDVGVVIVHYRAAALLRDALAAVSRDIEAAGHRVEPIVVDHGCGPGDDAILATLPARRIAAPNDGYAAGVNRGVAATTAPWLVVLNPDVIVAPGCIAALLAAAPDGIAGPSFYWDAGQRIRLPPGERRSRFGELVAALATRGPAWARVARRRWRRDAQRHWNARGPIPSVGLAGALFAFPRSAWDRVGPFDVRYRLYFEETEWLLRAARTGVATRYVPAATALHLHAASTANEPRSATWFEESARRFRVETYGRAWNGIVERLAVAALPAPPAEPLAAFLGRARDVARGRDVDLELSPNATGFPAASVRLAADAVATWTPPDDLRPRLPEAGMHAVAVDTHGRELVRGWVRFEAA